MKIENKKEASSQTKHRFNFSAHKRSSLHEDASDFGPQAANINPYVAFAFLIASIGAIIYGCLFVH